MSNMAHIWPIWPIFGNKGEQNSSLILGLIWKHASTCFLQKNQIFFYLYFFHILHFFNVLYFWEIRNYKIFMSK